MNPLTIALLMGGGALASGLGNWIQSKQGYSDPTQDWINKNNSGRRDLNWQNSERLTNALWGGGSLDPQTYLQKATGFTNNASDIYNQLAAGLGSGGRYSAKGMQSSFADMLPGLMQNASGVANAATSRAGESMTALAQRESARALNKMQAGLSAGGLFGAAAGPVAASMAYGAQEPLMQAQTAIDQLYSNAYGSAYNPMAAFAMGNIQQEPQNLANVGQLYGNLASQQYSAASPLLSLLGQQSQRRHRPCSVCWASSLSKPTWRPSSSKRPP